MPSDTEFLVTHPNLILIQNHGSIAESGDEFFALLHERRAPVAVA